MTHLVRFDHSSVMVEEGAPNPERVLTGAPVNRTWNIEDDGKGLYSGVWESTAGEWRVSYDEWEFCHIVEGVSILREDGAEPVTLKVGDSFIIRPGFQGTWTVVEKTVKHYVIKV